MSRPLARMRRTARRSKIKAALVTGFEPYGGYTLNPSAEIARRLDGGRIGGTLVAGRVLPVELDALGAAVSVILREVDPVAVIMLGLAPGESTIRLERVALNLAHFLIPDNSGARAQDLPLDARSGPALWARLPLRGIQARLLAMGIPARMSESAGTYLCNAAMHLGLRRVPRRVPCGFIHLPLLPVQVAEAIEGDGNAPVLASMAFPIQRRAVEVALAVTLGKPLRGPVSR